MTGGLVYIVLYYLPEKIFLSEFKYFAQWLNLCVWGWGKCRLTTGQASKEPHCTENSGLKGINTLGSIRSECDILRPLTK
jgi:hypothetical protein